MPDATFLGLTLSQWLGFSVAAAIVSAIGALMATVIKDYFLVRSFENWKRGRELSAVYTKYKDPIRLSATELCFRLGEIVEQFPPNFLRTEIRLSSPPLLQRNAASDPYFLKYKLDSTIYRFASFLGWIELYRQEIVYLQGDTKERSRRLELIVKRIRSDLADGHIHRSVDWHTWEDRLIFREELRAIGEAILISDSGRRQVMGYAQFIELRSGDGKLGMWTDIVENFLLSMRGDGKDFRRVRLNLLIVDLADLIELLGDGLTERLNNHRTAASGYLQSEGHTKRS